MERQVEALIQGGGGVMRALLVEEPNTCPTCHRNMHPQMFQAFKGPDWVQATYRCSAADCGRLFIATYVQSGNTDRHHLQSLQPTTPVPTAFPETVTEVSPNFIVIYNQAMAAESHQLEQLVGIGLRKALEFLIKDFLILQNAADTEAIKRTLLGACIANHVQDPNIKECATRATWLGNDETHYTRKWEHQDIEDLKRLVRLTSNWIDNVLMTKKYMTQMPVGR